MQDADRPIAFLFDPGDGLHETDRSSLREDESAHANHHLGRPSARGHWSIHVESGNTVDHERSCDTFDHTGGEHSSTVAASEAEGAERLPSNRPASTVSYTVNDLSSASDYWLNESAREKGASSAWLSSMAGLASEVRAKLAGHDVNGAMAPMKLLETQFQRNSTFCR
jgi:hypothetical protein